MKGGLYMLVATLCFAIMQVLVKQLDVPVAEIIVFRSGISFVLCWLTLRFKGESVLGKNHTPLVLRGVFGLMSLACFFYALQNAPLASVVTIVNIKPFLVVFFSFLILKDKVRWQQFLFFAISFSGILLVKGFDTRITNTDLAAILASALFASIAHFIVRSLKGKESPEVILFYFTLVTIPFVLPFAIHYWKAPQGIEYLQLILLGLVTHLGQLFLTKAYQSENIALVSNVYFMGIIFAVLFGYFLFEESYSLVVYGGLTLIIIGIVLNVVFGKRRWQLKSSELK